MGIAKVVVARVIALLGPGGAGLANWAPLAPLEQRLPLCFGAVEPVGDDLRIVARVQGRDAFIRP